MVVSRLLRLLYSYQCSVIAMSLLLSCDWVGLSKLVWLGKRSSHPSVHHKNFVRGIGVHDSDNMQGILKASFSPEDGGGALRGEPLWCISGKCAHVLAIKSDGSLCLII